MDACLFSFCRESKRYGARYVDTYDRTEIAEELSRGREISKSGLKIRVFSLVTIPSVATLFCNLSIVHVTPLIVTGGNMWPYSSFPALISLQREVPQLFPRLLPPTGKDAIAKYVNFLAVLAAVELGQTQRQCCSMRCVHISHILSS